MDFFKNICKKEVAPLQFYAGVEVSSSSNAIKTTKYNIFTFFPLALILQFKRLANFYFLVTAILLFIPIISPLTPLAAVVPLVFVLSVSMIRQGLEQYGKYKFDKECNSSQIQIFQDGWCIVRSDELKVGNIIKIYQNQRLPSDIIVLYVSNINGKCYIQTSSLDGQKNLKNKTPLLHTQQIFSQKNLKEKILTRTEFLVRIEEPHEQLYTFNGQLICFQKKVQKKSEFLKLNQFLYKDSVLKNTKFIIGVVAYSGKFTKNMLNSSNSRNKMSKLQKRVNFYMVFIFLLQTVLVILCAILRIFLYYTTNVGSFIQGIITNGKQNYSYLIQAVITAAIYFILLNTMIPISLLVSIQVVKFCQGLFINFDKRIKVGQINSKAFRSSINEELGMVQYIFTDKTGTLTCNQMALTQIIIGEKLFQNQIFQEQEDKNKNHQKNAQEKNTFYNHQLYQIHHDDLSFLNELVKKNTISDYKPPLSQKSLNSLMLLLMSTCHDCILVDKNQYHGSSPDQITLVSSACENRYKFLQNLLGNLKVQINNEDIIQLKLNQLFEFNSDRKRMSIIVSHPNLGKNYLMFSKGADSIMEQRLHKKYKTQLFSHELQKLKNKITDMSKKGLRTLIYAYRIIPQEQYLEFSRRFNKLNQNNHKQKQFLVSQLQDNFQLLGASGVQDKLQAEVPGVIVDLRKAGIKVIMLTGDKLQTAQNIAISCGLFDQNTDLIKITEKQTNKLLFQGYCKAQQIMNNNKKYSLLVEGGALPLILDQLYFSYLIQNCQSAVCCRITPKNKAQMVQLAKVKLKKLTLSIGDGANDVPMIMAANIGIGIYGNEGMNAVQASDFAIPQFRCLWRLLFVHGRWNYIRIAQLIKYFFYKNMLFTLCQLWYGYFCSFSGQSIYQAIYLTLFNTIFTAGPVVFRALLQQDINYVQILQEIQKQNNQKRLQKYSFLGSIRETLRKPLNNLSLTRLKKYEMRVRINKNLKQLFPNLYTQSMNQGALTPKLFFFVILQAILESFAVFMLCIYTIPLGEYPIVSICIYSTIMALATIRICYDITYWTTFIVLIILFTSIIPYLGFIYLDGLINFTFYGTFQQVFTNINFYLIVLVSLGVGATIQGTFSVLGKYYFPTILVFIRKQMKEIQQKQRQQEQIQMQSITINQGNLMQTYRQYLKYQQNGIR